MSQIADSVSGDGFAVQKNDAIEARLFRLMIASVGIAAAASTIVTPWRVTAGLTLGGSLSLLNYHWLRTSVAAVFNIDIAAERPRFKASRYILRYFVIGVIHLPRISCGWFRCRLLSPDCVRLCRHCSSKRAGNSISLSSIERNLSDVSFSSGAS